MAAKTGVPSQDQQIQDVCAALARHADGPLADMLSTIDPDSLKGVTDAPDLREQTAALYLRYKVASRQMLAEADRTRTTDLALSQRQRILFRALWEAADSVQMAMRFATSGQGVFALQYLDSARVRAERAVRAYRDGVMPPTPPQ